MIKLQEIYKLCEGFEKEYRNVSITKLISYGYSESTALNYYNIWRRHYMESSSKDLILSGVFIKKGEVSKLLEQCSYRERQKYLEALSKEQLIKVTQSVLK
ncbi:hypothetical protein KPL37_19020 [Clostridium frigoris]|uniref:Uncharacterized protein n=1 Tax=Clostridium frigoris TaxID=205327 RepID=A0ABS6BYT7_9CLOT|nr:hypothetical protein [Clostridium frigoris]MBU3161780.1 hypothetical protein [Clostridium frigoris]